MRLNILLLIYPALDLFFIPSLSNLKSILKVTFSELLSTINSKNDSSDVIGYMKIFSNLFTSFMSYKNLIKHIELIQDK